MVHLRRNKNAAEREPVFQKSSHRSHGYAHGIVIYRRRYHTRVPMIQVMMNLKSIKQNGRANKTNSASAAGLFCVLCTVVAQRGASCASVNMALTYRTWCRGDVAWNMHRERPNGGQQQQQQAGKADWNFQSAHRSKAPGRAHLVHGFFQFSLRAHGVRFNSMPAILHRRPGVRLDKENNLGSAQTHSTKSWQVGNQSKPFLTQRRTFRGIV